MLKILGLMKEMVLFPCLPRTDVNRNCSRSTSMGAWSADLSSRQGSAKGEWDTYKQVHSGSTRRCDLLGRTRRGGIPPRRTSTTTWASSAQSSGSCRTITADTGRERSPFASLLGRHTA